MSPIAVVVTERADQGEDAAERVVVDYEPLPAVVGVEAALEATCCCSPRSGRTSASTPRTSGSPGRPGPVRRLRHRRLGAARQSAPRAVPSRGARCRSGVDARRPARALGNDPDAAGRAGCAAAVYAPRRVSASSRRPWVVASGRSRACHAEEIMLAGVSAALQRAARWTETRSESMQSLGHGRAQRHDVTIGGTRDGRVLAYRLRDRAGRGCVSGVRRDHPRDDDPDHGAGRLRHRACRVLGAQRRHEHGAGRRVPRRGPTRGDRGDRTGDGPVRGRDRHGPGRGAPPEPDARVPTSRTRRRWDAVYDVGDYAGALDIVLVAAGLREASRASSGAAANAATWCSSVSVSAATSKSPARRSRVRSPRRLRAS